MTEKTTKKRVKLQLKAEPGKTVCVAGTFNNWDAKKNPLKESGKTGMYSATLSLAKGRYEYKFIVNDVWCVDPECPEWVPNNHGSLNSVLTV
jgi:1,4-alpha-glucan branching enzyme